jgi:hypothetical protein
MAHGKFGSSHDFSGSSKNCDATWEYECQSTHKGEYPSMCQESSVYGLVLLLLAAACAAPLGVRTCCKLKNRRSSQTDKATDVPSVV